MNIFYERQVELTLWQKLRSTAKDDDQDKSVWWFLYFDFMYRNCDFNQRL
jgi:hypothetical protein